MDLGTVFCGNPNNHVPHEWLLEGGKGIMGKLNYCDGVSRQAVKEEVKVERVVPGEYPSGTIQPASHQQDPPVLSPGEEPFLSKKGSEVRTTSSTGGEKGVKPQRYDLIPIGPLNQLATLYGNGAAKYAAHNFRKGYEWSKSYAAAMRHMTSFWNGEDIDPEMGVPHVICAAFHMFALAEFMEFHQEFDDRFKREEKLPPFPTEPSEGPYYPN